MLYMLVNPDCTSLSLHHPCSVYTQHPDYTYAEVSRTVADMWSNTSPDTRKKYEDQAAADVERYLCEATEAKKVGCVRVKLDRENTRIVCACMFVAVRIGSVALLPTFCPLSLSEGLVQLPLSLLPSP